MDPDQTAPTVHASDAIISQKSWYCCHVDVSILCLFLAVPWVCLWSAIVPGHNHLLFNPSKVNKW